MTYEQLANFIENKMRMSHIYQPVMLMTLLKNYGKCHEIEIAKAILEHDQSQVEYYQKITNNMVGRVLRNHQIVEKTGKDYSLVDYEILTPNQLDKLILLCRQKLHEYIEKRGREIWEHRRGAEGYISGTIRYEILKRAKYHCELCGIAADEKALDIDHIIPRNKGGTDDESNLQALCYSCNAMKRDRDDTDFHAVRESFKHRDENCLFCNIKKERVIAENELVYAMYDGYAVTPLHILIVPKRHVTSYFELGQSEINACNKMLGEIKQKIEADDKSVTGFNIGINNGESAGQTIFHCHIHLIPRRDGDVENPRGGVRNTIPGKGDY